MKNILLIVAIAFAFTACNKCKECKTNGNYYVGSYENMPDYGAEIIEICSDNFESKKDFNNYIDAKEETEGWDCKSDFWN